ncbi:endonuclease [Lutibacter sp. TH_r2]|uniref:endonuclease n=1 Tax=Lutibacter sp. TH_r2 TaxID=3082083 RepID=UPI002954281B|nr:endonuclease [Lutibacter sp. TH_r2]MDV7187518.1 endonuclease [Lutibacter sp. TH_r2]
MKKLLLFLLLVNYTLFAQQSYYDDVDLTKTGTDLRDELATKIITTHTTTLSYTPGVWEACKITDLDPDDATNSNVLLIYGSSDTDGNYVTDRTRDKDLNGGTSGTEWNREHTYAKSLGSPDLGTSGPGADAHHLRASDITLNGYRGSLKFATGSGTAGTSGSGWYPGDEWKGDVARMMMYMYLRYGSQCYPTGVAIGTTNSVDSNMIDLLLDWNAEDPVSDYEDQRNTHHDSSHQYAQGNRNPFIDNPNLATQIWGGPIAEDRWNVIPDTEAPTAPLNLAASNITNTTVDLTWTASTDNVAVTSYEIYIDGSLYDTSSTNSATLTGLTQNTAYSITVYAKDAAGNTSTVSNTENITTTNIIDTEDPSTITDLTSSNITSSSVDLDWTASTDNFGVTSYEIFQDGSLIGTSTTNSYSVSGLTSETSYSFTVYAKDAAGNTSTVSNTEMVTTLEISVIGGMYFQGFEGTANDTWNYSITPTNCNDSNNDVWDVVSSVGSISTANTDSYFFGVKDLEGNCGTSDGGTISFSAADLSNYTDVTLSFAINVVGYDVSYNDIITYEIFHDNVSQGAITITVGNPYSTSGWEEISAIVPNSVTSVKLDIYVKQNGGSDYAGIDDVKLEGTSTLSNDEFENNLFNVYPNPTKNNKVTIALNNTSEVNSVEFYNMAGQLIISKQQPTISNNKIEMDNIPSGMYIVKVQNNTSQSIKRLVVN